MYKSREVYIMLAPIVAVLVAILSVNGSSSLESV